MTRPEYDPAMCGDRMTLMHPLRHCYPDEVDVTDCYVEQSEKNGNVATLRFVTGMGEFSMTFVSAESLDRLSDFYAEAAQQLRTCTK